MFLMKGLTMKRLVLMVVFSINSLYGMCEYRKAQGDDVQGILTLMNSEAVNESNKLVILPKKFRENALIGSIAKGRLFVATKNQDIVGYKKLFFVTDEDEKNELLHNELRCIGGTSQCVFTGLVNETGAFFEHQKPFDALTNKRDAVCIYDGADFTKNSERGLGINRSLTNAALQTILPEVRTYIDEHDIKSVVLLYGLTCANAGAFPGSILDRTMSIAKSFGLFIKKLGETTEPVTFAHARYNAFMPTFDSESEECRPLPDNCSIPGFGCLLSCLLKGRHE